MQPYLIASLDHVIFSIGSIGDLIKCKCLVIFYDAFE